MKKILSLMMLAGALAFAFTSCHKEPTPEEETGIGTFKVGDIVDAAAAAYKTWEDEEAFPETFKIADKDFTIANYQYAICKALVNLSAGDKGDIKVPNYKPAEHPERDSYDKETIAIANGPKNGDETEDLVNVAKRMLARMDENLQVPNQTNFTRNGSAIAFSTDRATIVISRALGEYKAEGKLPESIDAGYKGASNTLKAFAKELVKYLDVWEKTVGTVDADGSHCTSNKTAWQNVHFIPIEYSGGYKDGTMYGEDYRPYYHVVVDGHEYTAAECWSIAAQGIMDMVTKEGSALMQPTRNPFIHTMGNGKGLNAPYPAPAEYATVTGFNAYPWYENTNDGPIINFSDTMPCTIEFIAHELGWYLTRCTQFDTPAIGNFQQFGKGEGVINFGDYAGTISAMRTFLIMIRFYDYLLKNNIEDNIWDATKDVHLNYDLYGVDMPDIELKTSSLDFDCTEQTKEVKFTAKKAWTATVSDSWISVDPASGEAGDIVMKVTAAENKGDARTGKVVIKGGNVTEGLEIAINQVKYTEPSKATIKEFAQEYVKILDIWASTVGTIDYVNGEKVEPASQSLIENAHYVPMATTITVGGKTYNTADMLETALRSFLLLRGFDGLETEKNGFGNIPAVTPVTMNETVPPTHDYYFGSYPYAEPSNGGYLVKVEGEKEIHCQVEMRILDNWAQRSVNFQHGHGITNMCTYPRSDHNINDYKGCFSSMRALLTYAYFFRYMLDNNLEKADAIPADQIIHSELFGNEEGSIIDEPASLKDFALEFVKGLEVWENTVGTVDADGKHCTANGTAWQNVHFIPIEGNPNSEYYKEPGNQYDPKWASKIWKLNVKGKEYSSSQAWEIAIRGLMNMVTAEGEALLPTMDDRNKAYTLQNSGALSKLAIPEPSADNKWGKHPWYEADNLVKNNGQEVTEVDVNFMVKVGAWHVVRSFIKTGGNASPLEMVGNFQEFGTSSGTLNLEGYKGYISPMRELLVLMRIYKYLLDNNIDSNVYTAIQGQKFDFDLYGEGKKTTVADFAKQYVKIIDVWEKNVGTVNRLSNWKLAEHGDKDVVENAHYIPDGTTISVGGKTYNTADMLETALRSYLLLRGWDGLETEKNGYGNIPTATPVAMSETEVPPTHEYSFGTPLIESSNGGYLYKQVGDKQVFGQVDPLILDNWAQRSVNFQHGKNITNFCGYPRDPITNYGGCFSSGRALITYAFFFKYMLDKNLDKADGLGADVVIRSELFGLETAEAAGGITTADDLLAYLADPSKDAELGADIDLTGKTFTPGDLKGTFDGKGHKITYKLEVPADATYNAGLFSTVDGTVKNLKVVGSITSSAANVGGVAGASADNAVFENCESYVDIVGPIKASYRLGGIVGLGGKNLKIKNCINNGSIGNEVPDMGAGNAIQLGGIVGHMEETGSAQGCTNNGKLYYTAKGTPRIGGILGYFNNLVEGSFTNCTNNGEIAVVSNATSGYNYVAGITGYYGTPANASKVSYKKCVNTGNITFTGGVSSTAFRVGGILCHCGGTKVDTSQPLSVEVTDCSNSGNISTSGDGAKHHVGGIIGFTETSTCIVACNGCTNTGSITVEGAGVAGGIHGYSCNPASTFTNFTVGKNVVISGPEGTKIGMVIGSGYVGDTTSITTALTGKVQGGKIVLGGSATDVTADNYKTLLAGDGFVGSVDGVTFGE